MQVAEPPPKSRVITAGFPSQAALGLVVARVALGVTAIARPALVARPWIGDEARQPGGAVLGRALAGRDVALGIGLARSWHKRRPFQGWVEAGTLAGLVDKLTTLGAFARLPRRGRWLVLASAGCAAVAGGLVARAL